MDAKSVDGAAERVQAIGTMRLEVIDECIKIDNGRGDNAVSRAICGGTLNWHRLPHPLNGYRLRPMKPWTNVQLLLAYSRYDIG